jgi:polyphosphate glucokinase
MNGSRFDGTEKNPRPGIALGVDVGGTGIKASLVATANGEMTAERRRVPTPQPATPDAVVEVVAELVEGFDWRGPVGVGFLASSDKGAS